MMGRIATYLFATVIGGALGLASALYFTGLWPGMKPLDFGDVDIDGWRSDFAIGSEAADPYTRARVARHGLLALAKSEAVYFTRTTDDAGQPLTEDCTYQLGVFAIPAAWWSITLYDSESLLPMNEDDALSVNADQDGATIPIVNEGFPVPLNVTVSAHKPDGKGLWISSRNAGAFDLTLRLYQPDLDELEGGAETIHSFSLPSIQRISCKGDAS